MTVADSGVCSPGDIALLVAQARTKRQPWARYIARYYNIPEEEANFLIERAKKEGFLPN